MYLNKADFTIISDTCASNAQVNKNNKVKITVSMKKSTITIIIIKK